MISNAYNKCKGHRKGIIQKHISIKSSTMLFCIEPISTQSTREMYTKKIYEAFVDMHLW